MYSPKGKY